MGYPMTYKRVVNRNNLKGDYDPSPGILNEVGRVRSLLMGGLRRLEVDQRDDAHITA